MDSDTSSDDENLTDNREDPNLQANAGLNYTVVPGAKPGTKLVKYKNFLYRARKCNPAKKRTYLRCRHMTRKKLAGGCDAAAIIKSGLCAEKDQVQKPHTCASLVTAPGHTEAHELMHIMKQRAAKEGTLAEVCKLSHLTNQRVAI